MRFATFSSFGNAVLCIGAAVLPRQREDTPSTSADRGVSLHWYLRRAGDVGPDAALKEIPAEHQLDAEELPLEMLPCGPEFEREVSLAVDLLSGAARRIDPPQDGEAVRYADVGDLEVAGTLDSARMLSALHAYVSDYKSGFLLSPSAHLWQLRLGAMAYAGLHGATRVTAVLIRFDEKMQPRETVYEWTAADLDAFREEALGHALRWLDRRARLNVLPVDATEVKAGPEQCRYCRSYVHCPRKLQLVRARTERLEQIGTAMITAAMVADAWRFADELKKLAGRVQAECCRIAATQSVDLGDGTVLGMAPKESSEINGGVAWTVLREMFGPEHGHEIASVGVEMDASKASIGRAMKRARELDLIKARGMKAKADEVLHAISARGGLTSKETMKVRVFKAPPAANDDVPADLPPAA